jgi:hypothetical protein
LFRDFSIFLGQIGQILARSKRFVNVLKKRLQSIIFQGKVQTENNNLSGKSSNRKHGQK